MVNIIQLTSIFAASEEVSGIGALGLDPLAILAQAATFLLLFWVLKKFALDKIVATLEARRKTIDDGIRLGREMEAEKEKLDETVAKTMKKARIETDKIITSGHEEAAGIIKESEEAASRRAETMMSEANARLEEEITDARKSLEKEMRSLVAEATEVIIKTKLDKKQDEKLLNESFKQVAEGNK